MKTYKLYTPVPEPAKPEPKVLTYDEMLKQEGVYTLTGAPASSLRFVVVGTRSEDRTVLYYDEFDGKLVAAVSGWRTSKFIRIDDAKVFFQIEESK